MGLAKANRHPDEELTIDLDYAVILVDCLEKLEDDFDLGKQEVLIVNVSGANKGAEQVYINNFLGI